MITWLSEQEVSRCFPFIQRLNKLILDADDPLNNARATSVHIPLWHPALDPSMSSKACRRVVPISEMKLQGYNQQRFNQQEDHR